LNVCTIIAKNYLAHARVLGRSLAATHPGTRLQTLVIDDFTGYIDPAQEPFDILTPEDVGCDAFVHMALRYSVLELSTAVKPWLLRHLLARTGEPVTYLDPDIQVFGSLQTLEERAAAHGVVLIPHNSKPIPQDGRRPSQVDVMIAGIYNLGYVSLAPGPEVEQLLDWWADRLRRDCRVDPMWGYFVDQRWFDLAPGFLSDLAIVRDPEFNLAYWNLHERTLEHRDGTYTVDGRPLGFFHFSGFDPLRPSVLSRHQDRVDVESHPVLAGLLEQYAQTVMAEGHDTSRRWPYEFSVLGDGTPLDDKLRDLFDQYATEHDDDVPSPFTLAGIQRFDEWLRQPAPGAPPQISRALARIYEDRPDVRGAFPDIGGPDLARFLKWAAHEGGSEEPVLARLKEHGLSPQAAPATKTPSRGKRAGQRRWLPGPRGTAPLRGAPWGVNVVGDFRSDSEQGQAARGLVSGLDASGVRVLPILSPAGDGAPDDRGYPARPVDQAPFAVNLVCIRPERFAEFARNGGGRLFGGRYTVGMWFWDSDHFEPGLADRFELVEEVWAPSRWSAEAIESLATVPVHAMPMPVAPGSGGLRTRAELGLPEGTFLFNARLDHGTGFERQNPLAVIEAFRRTFSAGEGAGLVIECRGALSATADHARLIQAAAVHPDITVLDHAALDADAATVTSLCDSYVSLHRATAFGLGSAEAMWFGRPVIATGYSGNLEYMDAGNAHLVDHRLVAIGSGQVPLPADGRWAEPDVEHAGRLMRDVFDRRDEAQALGERAARDIRASYSPDAASQALRERIDAIRATGRARRGIDPVAEHPRILTALPMRLAQGPAATAPSGARGHLRRAVLRAMRPFTAYQASVNADVVAALAELSRDVAEARDHSAAEWADILAGARREGARTTDRDDTAEEIKRILTLETDRAVYLALAQMRERYALIGPESGDEPAATALTPFELRVFSQNGEDGVLAEILRRVGAPARHFVEFGVESGREGNCVYLADVAGWHGLFIEAGEEMFRLLEDKYAAREGVKTIRARVTARNVEALFAQAGVPEEPDVVSIDVDGQDYWIWEAIERYRPRVMIVEYNSAIDPRRRLVQPDEAGRSWDGTDRYGASVAALQVLAERKGYRLVHTDLSAVNAFFVRADLAGHAFPEPGDVAVRGTPNYYQRGIRHPEARGARRYLDLDSGRLVSDGRHDEPPA
jgi:glycosyltransferase involved in cell wall biosynthesis